MLARGKHVICLEEVHGFEGEVLSEFASVLPGWVCFHSPILNDNQLPVSGCGGVAVLVCPEIASNAEFQHTVLIPGRAQMLDIICNFNSSNTEILDKR